MLQIFLHGVTSTAAMFCAPMYFLCVYKKFYIADNVILNRQNRHRLTPASYPPRYTPGPSLSCKIPGIVQGSLLVVGIGTLFSLLVVVIRALIVIFNTVTVSVRARVNEIRYPCFAVSLDLTRCEQAT